jgi:hypothetical protein
MKADLYGVGGKYSEALVFSHNEDADTSYCVCAEGPHCSVVVKKPCYKPEGRGFEIR